MREVVFTLDYCQPGFGRPEAVVMLARQLAERGWPTRLLVGEGDPGMMPADVPWAIQRACTLDTPGVFEDSRLYGRRDEAFAAWLRDQLPDRAHGTIVHCQDVADLWALAGWVDAPVVVSWRTDLRQRLQGWAGDAILELSRICDWVEVWNPDVLDWLRERGVSRDRSSWNCSGVPDLPPARRLEWPGRPEIVCASRIAAGKNQMLLIEALPAVIDAFPDVHVTFIGDGDQRAVCEAAAVRLGVAERVAFTGWLPEGGRLVAGADLCVHSSTGEGFSRSVMEAMLAGVPLTVAEPSAAVIAHGRFGSVHDPHDPGDLAAKIVADLNSPATAQRTAAAQAHARETYTTDAAVRRTIEVYERLESLEQRPASVSAARA